jgi:hypothetical protein
VGQGCGAPVLAAACTVAVGLSREAHPAGNPIRMSRLACGELLSPLSSPHPCVLPPSPPSSIALARGLYSSAPVLLIDDALSALDGPVAAVAWRCGLGRGPTGGPPSLMDAEGRARVVVTNNRDLVKDADWVVVRRFRRVPVSVCEVGKVWEGVWEGVVGCGGGMGARGRVWEDMGGRVWAFSCSMRDLRNKTFRVQRA